jgi:hypothetical protein
MLSQPNMAAAARLRTHIALAIGDQHVGVAGAFEQRAEQGFVVAVALLPAACAR